MGGKEGVTDEQNTGLQHLRRDRHASRQERLKAEVTKEGQKTEVKRELLDEVEQMV